jgi:alkylation response protein AidB-like acyl-CoA dehydrogenase
MPVAATKAISPLGLKERIAPLLPQFAAQARATEKAGRVPAEAVEALRALGYFESLKPAAYGGHPGRFADLVDANIDVSAACPSTGWVAGLLAAHQWLLAMFPKAAQDDVWGADPEALLCGSYAPTLMAESVPGGYRLSGRWAFASGCDNAQWALCAAILPPAQGRSPGPAFLLVPAADYTMDDDWDVVGLIGTGSKTLLLDGVVVPPHRILTFAQATSGHTPGAELYADQPLFNIPLLSAIPASLASTAVGAAKGALDAYLDNVAGRVTRGAVAGANKRMRELPTIQLRVAEAAASVDAAREILLRDLSDAENIAARTKAFPLDQRLKCRRGQAFAVKLAIQAVEALNASTGGLGLQMSNPVQRAWRDANAVGRHISMNWDTVGTMVGQHLFGLEPNGQY